MGISASGGIQIVQTETQNTLVGVTRQVEIVTVGVQGPAGATLPAELWFSGSGAPAGGLGNDGDLYLDTSTGDVYEKSGTWGIIANIKGPQGDPGGAGAGILSGAGTPAGGLGSDGDYYRNTDDSTFWYKSGGAWACISDFDTVDGGYY